MRIEEADRIGLDWHERMNISHGGIVAMLEARGMNPCPGRGSSE